MSDYRGYFMKDDHIVAPASIEAADDAQALRKASALLTTSHFGIEVWHGFRRVGAIPAPAISGVRRQSDKDGLHSSEGDMPNIIEFRQR